MGAGITKGKKDRSDAAADWMLLWYKPNMLSLQTPKITSGPCGFPLRWIKQVNRERNTLPSQCFPSPLNPVLHVHLYEPWVVWQIASMWQPSLPSAHGSVEIHTGLKDNDNPNTFKCTIKQRRWRFPHRHSGLPWDVQKKKKIGEGKLTCHWLKLKHKLSKQGNLKKKNAEKLTWELIGYIQNKSVCVKNWCVWSTHTHTPPESHSELNKRHTMKLGNCSVEKRKF